MGLSFKKWNKASLAGLFLWVLPGLCLGQDNEMVLTTSQGDDRHPWWSPDGKTIVFESNRNGQWDLYSIDSSGANERRLTDHSSNDRSPSWYPDGSGILFESDRSGKAGLYKLEMPGLNVIPILLEDFDLAPTMARISPDGTQLIFSANLEQDRPNLNLFLTSSKGGMVKQLTFDPTRSLYPSWAPDSKQVVFFSRRDTQGEQDELYTQSIDKPEEAKRLTHYEIHDFCPHWSADGEHIVFSRSMKDDRPEIFIITKDGTGAKRITFTQGEGETQAVWSPNGQQIAFAGYRNGSYQICLLPVNN